MMFQTFDEKTIPETAKDRINSLREKMCIQNIDAFLITRNDAHATASTPPPTMRSTPRKPTRPTSTPWSSASAPPTTRRSWSYPRPVGILGTNAPMVMSWSSMGLTPT